MDPKNERRVTGRARSGAHYTGYVLSTGPGNLTRIALVGVDGVSRTSSKVYVLTDTLREVPA